MQAPTYLNTREALGLQNHALIAQLNENFPPVTPTPSDSIAKIMYQSGQRSVVEFILSLEE
jgi:hypothetical protein